ncbi:NAD(P)H-binding protein [Streptomyces sp. HC44]|uniref:NAD(P)H-binding protein n=1 Tax=Streptomyces scabichelini TaxID=2711217 RepID=A0A6G4VLF3_9ACTN|nr:NAD(P)H-binding protein [Streptomyces scabichelini]NGO14617.1 NAD(P)H-binding protein [Streptomyces scabichelini]
MKVLMVGATGATAGAVLPELVARGVDVRALVRDERRAEAARRRGAAGTVIADLTDPASLRAAAAANHAHCGSTSTNSPPGAADDRIPNTQHPIPDPNTKVTRS